MDMEVEVAPVMEVEEDMVEDTVEEVVGTLMEVEVQVIMARGQTDFLSIDA